MRVPIILLSGAANSGKDTVADFLVKNHGAVKIAQADPMKRLAMKLFGFSEETLWGPSERRNDALPKDPSTWGPHVDEWLREVLPDGAPGRNPGLSLFRWFERMQGNVSARHVLQTLGTEWGRAFSRNMWVDLALRNARALLEGGHVYNRRLGLSEPSDPPVRGYDLVVITDGRFRNEILAVRAAGGATVKIVSPGAGLSGDAAKHSSETEQDGIPESWFDVVLENDKVKGLEHLEKDVARALWSATDDPFHRSWL